MGGKTKDLRNTKLGDLLIVELDKKESLKRNRPMWRCKCICGWEGFVCNYHLSSKIRTSCSGPRCKKLPVGFKFGNYKLIGFIGKDRTQVDEVPECSKKRNAPLYKLICICGKSIGIEWAELKRRTKARLPECSNCNTKRFTNDNYLSSKVVDTRYKQYKRSAKYRKIDFLLSTEEVSSLIFSDCTYCGSPPNSLCALGSTRIKRIKHNIKNNGIDRIDSSKSYVMENCVVCCADCNRMKNKHDIKFFYKKIIAIYKYSNLASFKLGANQAAASSN